MRTFLTLVFALALAFAPPAAAQCAPIPGTGCPGQSAPLRGTNPATGTNVVFRCAPSCFPSSAQFVVLGTSLTPVALPSPPLCVPGCMLACQPLLVVAAPGLTIPIPNNPGLVGLQLCVQCLCQPTGGTCFELTQATQVTVM